MVYENDTVCPRSLELLEHAVMNTAFLIFLGGDGYYSILTVCPRSSGPFYVVTYYIKWVTNSWIYCIIFLNFMGNGYYSILISYWVSQKYFLPVVARAGR